MLIDLTMYGIIQMGLIHWKSISILREKKGTLLKPFCFQDYNYYSKIYNCIIYKF